MVTGEYPPILLNQKEKTMPARRMPVRTVPVRTVRKRRVSKPVIIPVPPKRGFRFPPVGSSAIVDLVYVGALGALVVVEAVEWPIAALFIGAKLLADQKHNKMLSEIGKGLERA